MAEETDAARHLDAIEAMETFPQTFLCNGALQAPNPPVVIAIPTGVPAHLSLSFFSHAFGGPSKAPEELGAARGP
ncbi:hypothetical protein ColTof4_08069 [Colletotrichum tofieldiae]|nr:hypothetical protein ColTof3_02408 [Colletotrichum tofieldiae]GKT75646.1 hypothetical protein ColTof4_08069 [Colletotrichum tofieldiae]